MSKKIWKYPLNVVDEQIVRLPKGAILMTVVSQYDNVCMYALVDPDEKDYEPRTIRLYGTGHELDEREHVIHRFLGSCITMGGSLVWHVFEVEVCGHHVMKIL